MVLTKKEAAKINLDRKRLINDTIVNLALHRLDAAYLDLQLVKVIQPKTGDYYYCEVYLRTPAKTTIGHIKRVDKSMAKFITQLARTFNYLEESDIEIIFSSVTSEWLFIDFKFKVLIDDIY